MMCAIDVDMYVDVDSADTMVICACIDDVDDTDVGSEYMFY